MYYDEWISMSELERQEIKSIDWDIIEHINRSEAAKRAGNGGSVRCAQSTRDKISLAHKGKYGTKVYCPELDRIFDSITIAELELNINNGGISAHLSGAQKSAGKHPKTGQPLRWFRIDDLGNVIGDINRNYSDNRVKVVYCVELDKFFNGTRAVERELGITHNCVSACCSGKQNAEYGR